MATGIKKLDRFIDKIKSIPIEDFIGDSLSEENEYVVGLIGEQHEEGIDGTGGEIRPKYTTERYARFKRSIGSTTSPTPDLKVTGEFRRKIKGRVRKDRMDIFGESKKTPFLKKRYGNPILDHTQENIGNIGTRILPTLQKDTKKYLLNG